MDFSEGMEFLASSFGDNMTKADFAVAAFGAALNESKHNMCTVINKDTKYIDGVYKKGLSQKDARLIINNLDNNSLSLFFRDRMTESPDSQDEIAEKIGYTDFEDKNDLADHVADFFVAIIKTRTVRQKQTNQSAINELKELTQNVEDAVNALPQPRSIPVPDIPGEDERKYISELFKAYEDDCGQIVNDSNIGSFADYSEDLKTNRIRYFAAESIRRGIMELKSHDLENQFDVLKAEIYYAVLPSYKLNSRNTSLNGYLCELDIMKTAGAATVTSYILSKSPNWIDNKIKQGVCHFLVNDGKLKWTKEQ